jgi:hypothetical protein
MRLALKHPLWSALAFEALLVLLFWIFPAGACNSPVVGRAVTFFHYPSLLFVEHVLGIGFSGTQALLSAVLMIPVWIGTLILLRSILGYARKRTRNPSD